MINNFEKFIDDLANTEVPSNVYNQYSYECEYNAIRRNNLLIYLNGMKKLKPKIILIAEAPGYRGSRFTGVPFTSEHLLMNNIDSLNFFGRKKGYEITEENERPLKEATSTIIWRTLLRYNIDALGWNAFPFHPYKKDNKKKNRTPLKKELLMGEMFITQMIDMFNIQEVVAVGNKSADSLLKLNIEHKKIRHPAQGGKNEFVNGISMLVKELNI